MIFQRFYDEGSKKGDHVHLGLFGGPKRVGDGVLVMGEVLRAGNAVLGGGGQVERVPADRGGTLCSATGTGICFETPGIFMIFLMSAKGDFLKEPPA